MINRFQPMRMYDANAYVIVQSAYGGPHMVRGSSIYNSSFTPLYVCDTAEEAEEVRLLLERHREEVEALMRKRE